MGYELNGYADDTDKADERGFKKLRYTIINDKLKSAFVRLIRVVRVSIYSLLHQSVPMPHFNSPNATPQQFKRHTSMAQMNGIAEAKVWHLACNSVALYKRSFSQQKQENNFILSYTNLHFHPINSIFPLKTRIYATIYIE